MTTCAHCKRPRRIHRRGLCGACGNRPEVLRLYPSRAHPNQKREMTARELDELEAEQRKHLPRWWASEERKQGRGGDHDVRDAD